MNNSIEKIEVTAEESAFENRSPDLSKQKKLINKP